MLVYVADRRECSKTEEAQEITIDDFADDSQAVYDDFLREVKSVSCK